MPGDAAAIDLRAHQHRVASPTRRRKTFPPQFAHPAFFSASMVAGAPLSPSVVSLPHCAHT
jgi:hypothetical protein